MSDNTQITDTNNYLTYTVTKNGTYTFQATNEAGKTVETTVKVSNIETFTPIEEVATVTIGSNAYSYKGAVVPRGYYVDTESKLDTGLVITDGIDSEGYSTGNEWVWVPVNSEVGNEDYYIEEEGTLAGIENITYSKYGKLYSFSQPKIRDEYGIFYRAGNSELSTLGTPSEAVGYREPAILTDSAYGEVTYYDSINKRGTVNKCKSVEEVATQYISDYNNMITSVDQYNGFYIGRYEISGSETQGREKSGEALTDLNWYQFYNACMTFDNEYVTSGMIYGTLWDATMQWLAKSYYSVGYTGNTTSGYGNYQMEEIDVKDNKVTIIVKLSGISEKLQTGQTSYTRINNIYDLSGNCYDWTQEAQNGDCRVLRGGYYFTNDNLYTCSSYRGTYYPTLFYDRISSRPCLYIK